MFVSGLKFDYQNENVSLSDITLASSILDLTSKFKDSAIVSAIPLPKLSSKINIFTSPGAEYEGTNSQIVYDTMNPVMTADEAVELPPVIPLSSEDLIDLNISRIESPGVDCLNSASTDGNKIYKDVYNISQRSNSGSRRNSTISCGNSRTELLDRIGEQQYEDVLFKPKHKKRHNKTKTKTKTFMSGTESGSDTMSVNSIRSTSDSEDPWSSERLEISSDWSTSTKQIESNKRSSSEETLVRLGDCISSDVATLPGDNSSEHDVTIHENSIDEPNALQKIKDKRPSDLSISEECSVPPEIQPDLRSPASIERDVANKERILAKVLKLDTLCDGDTESEKGNVEDNCDIKTIETTEFIGEKINSKYVTSHSCVMSDETQANDKEVILENQNPDESNTSAEPQDEKLASLTSILSYGPPSGSSAPPSHHASLEMCTVPDLKVESSCENGDNEAVERPDRWMQYKVPDTISNISVCKYYVCCTDYKNIVYYSGLNGLSLNWHKVDYKAKQVSISHNGNIVWKIHKNVAYALENPTTRGPFGNGGRWKVAAQNVQWISVSDNIAWYISDGCIFVQKHLSADYPCNISSSPIHCNLPVTKISCFQETVIALTCTGEILIRTGISRIVPEGKGWKTVVTPCPVVMDIALGFSNTAWIVDQKSYVHFSCNVSAPVVQWWSVLISEIIFQQTTPMQQFRNKLTENYLSMRQQASATVAAGEDTVWIADKTATVYMNKTEFTGHQWNKVTLRHHIPSIKWKKICAEGIYEDKGQLWLLSTAGDFFSCRPNSQTFHGLPLADDCPIVCIAAAIDTVWTLSAKGRIHIRQGVSDTHPDGSAWKLLNLTQIDGIHFTHVSCGCDVVWACDNQGDVYMAVGPPHSMAGSTFSPVWIQVDDKLQRKNIFTKVFVGPQMYMVWAIDNKKNVYVREGVFNDYQIGTGWVSVTGIEAVELSISGSAVWALSARGSIYRRYGITETNFIGDYWKKIPGNAITLTASVSDGLWALDKNDSLLRHSQCTKRMNEDPLVSNFGVQNLSADGDWEVV
ncbi:hypothetical protein L9F63_017661, partial [Diploptera punctata]